MSSKINIPYAQTEKGTKAFDYTLDAGPEIS